MRSALEELVVEPLVIPESIDVPEAGAFLAVCRLVDQAELELWGNTDRAATSAQRLRSWRSDEYNDLRMFVARLDGEVVGRLWVVMPLRENKGKAELNVLVGQPWRGRGIGRALIERAEQIAAQQGRTILEGYTEQPADFDPDSVALLAPVSGTGALPADSRDVLFLQRNGYTLEQVERFSVLQLPLDEAEVQALERTAAERSAGYRILSWVGKCPQHLVEEYAGLCARMATDAPTAGLHYEEEIWDEKRVRSDEDEAIDAGSSLQVSAAQHLETGRLVAYTVLTKAEGKDTLEQDDTLVAMGFRPAGCDGEWQKKTDDDGAVPR
ncbi:GNAT family N-acetyltransferase [Arthrobacter sp. H5]|uniref:GNAT family N-acetyltransferase n=1 Tax=Arthrobacter sp. H5 TaxID=1267973 RepID=UPI00138AB66A|nr:GNAT family N-acetyltransferase [Arthrobacter sp. H5]